MSDCNTRACGYLLSVQGEQHHTRYQTNDQYCYLCKSNQYQSSYILPYFSCIKLCIFIPFYILNITQWTNNFYTIHVTLNKPHNYQLNKIKLTLEYSVMASMRAKVAWERKVLALSVTREAARLIRESWERFSSCDRGETGNKVRRWILSMTAIRWPTHSPVWKAPHTAHRRRLETPHLCTEYLSISQVYGLQVFCFLTGRKLNSWRKETRKKQTHDFENDCYIHHTLLLTRLIRSMVETLKKTR